MCFLATNTTQKAETDMSITNQGSTGEKHDTHAAVLDSIYEKFPLLPDSWISRLSAKHGWNNDTIEKMGLRLQTFYMPKVGGRVQPITWKVDRIVIPIHDKAGDIVNLRLYKPGAKKNKIISWGRGYGQPRLFPAEPVDAETSILLCGDEEDTLCALSHGFNAITLTANNNKWTASHLKPFKGHEVVIAYNADRVGQKCARYTASVISTVSKSVAILTWPDCMGSQADGSWPTRNGESVSKYFCEHGGTVEGLQALIDVADIYTSDKDDLAIDGHDPWRFFEINSNGRSTFHPRLLAEHLMKEMNLLNDPMTGLMYRWNGRWWELFQEDHVRKVCLEHLGKESQRSRAEDVVYQIRMLSTIPHGRTINDCHQWTCLQNGMLNLKTLEIVPHRKDFYATVALGVSFNPENTKRCDRWLKYLEETIQTPEAIAQAQEFAGYCLTRETRFAKCLLLVGPGSDGKSTFLKILQKLVGEENCSSVAFQDLEKEFQRAFLYGKLLNVSTEVGTKALESPIFKAVVTGDTINASFKHHDVFDFTPYCKLAFAANKLPKILDNSDGLFRRLLPIKFKHQFVPGEDADPYLEEKLEAELSQIFNWALVGLHRLWEQQGFTHCPETDALLMEYRLLNNPVLCFVEDHCVLGDDLTADKTELYSVYETYCRDRGYHKMNDRNFFRELYAAQSALRPMRGRCGGKRVQQVKGIGIVSTDFGVEL